MRQNSSPIFRHLWIKDHENTGKQAYTGMTDCSLQRHFPIDDTLLHAWDIRDQVAKLLEIMPKVESFWAPKFWGMSFPGRGAVVSIRHSLVRVKFLRGSASQHWRYYHSNNWPLVSQNYTVLLFSICGQRYTGLGHSAREIFQFAMTFSELQYRVSVWRYFFSNKPVKNRICSASA